MRAAPCRRSFSGHAGSRRSRAVLALRGREELPHSQRVRRAAADALPSGAYDYIIVGGGLAGCVLANRLSSDPEKSVLVIEAGEDNADPIVKVPAGLTRLFQNPTLDWNLETTPQAAMGGRASYLARGKLLGGSSATNATLYHRGAAADYDGWGLEGWSAQDVLPWFCAAEDNPAFGNSEYHRTGGAMHVEMPIYKSELFDRHFAAAASVGLKRNPDFNDWSRDQEGYGEFQVSITPRGRRADGFRQYLKAALGRENLTVATRAQASRIAFEQRGGERAAVGVEIQGVRMGATPGGGTAATGERSTVSLKAGGDVLLTAGAVHSPQLLQVSGIGPSRHLSDAGVPVIADIPGVGANLQDHPAILTAFEFDKSFTDCVTDHVYDSAGNIRPRQILNWAVLGRGALTSTGCDRGAFVRTSADRAQPDLQIRMVAALALDANAIGSYVKFGALKREGKIDRWPPGITFQLLAARAESRGSVRITSPSVATSPAIDLAYLSDPGGADAATLRAGVRLTRRMAAAAPWADLVTGELHPGAARESDGDLDAYVRESLHSGNALVGTCAMGADASRGGVVSPADLRVHGVSGVRVVDSSVLPRIPGGQTGAPVVMVAERAAAMLMQGRDNVYGAPAPARELVAA